MQRAFHDEATGLHTHSIAWHILQYIVSTNQASGICECNSASYHFACRQTSNNCNTCNKRW
jgi:hypothetical protein